MTLWAVTSVNYDSGFEEVEKGCCGTGNIEVSILCNPLTKLNSCPDADNYIFWDSYHPSQKTYKILTTHILNTVR